MAGTGNASAHARAWAHTNAPFWRISSASCLSEARERLGEVFKPFGVVITMFEVSVERDTDPPGTPA